jgi:hypothetical protein
VKRALQIDEWEDWSPSFIPHRATVIALEFMSNYRRHEFGRQRPRNLHLVAVGGMGKSFLLTHYQGQHGASERSPDGAKPVPVILIEAPEDGNFEKLSQRMLRACYPSFNPVPRSSYVEDCPQMLLAAGVRQILIDEAGNLLNSGPAAQQRCLAFLKRLSNCGFTLVVATTEDFRSVLAADKQLRSRFREALLPAWRESEELRGFLAALERQLPFDQPSGLSGREVVRWVVAKQLSTGEIVDALRDATVYALRREAACLDISLLELAAQGDLAPDSRFLSSAE